MDLSKLSRGQQIGLGSGLLLIINLFLPWYRISIGGFSSSANAFDAEFWAWGGSFVAIAGALILGGLGLLLIILRLLTETSNLFIGVFIGILAAGGVTYGSFMAMKDAGLELPSADDFKSIAGGDDDGGGE